MPFADADPHRRNLIVVSLAIIVYQFTCGELVDGGKIKFPLVNVVLNDPHNILPAFVVAILVWFWWRYLQINPLSDFRKRYIEEDLAARKSSLLVRFALRIKEKQWPNKSPALLITNIVFSAQEWNFKFLWKIPVNIRKKRFSFIKICYQHGGGSKSHEPSGFWGWILCLLVHFESFVKSPSILTQFSPHVFFFFALFSETLISLFCWCETPVSSM